MADQRMIGDILSERRRSLGLSLDRVVNDTKLQRRMVEAFELSDFDAMPPRGYAQASLASYARYLGLNPNEILRVYEDQLYQFQLDMSMNAQTSRNRGFAPSPDYPPERGPRPVSSRGASASFDAGMRSGRYGSQAFDPHGDPRYAPMSGEADYPQMPQYGAPRPNRSVSRARHDAYGRAGHSSDYVRSVDRGLYDSGYRRTQRAASSQAGYGEYERQPSRRNDRSTYDPVYPEDRSSRRGYEPSGSRSDRYGRDRGRGEVQIVTLDDGYQGGSGGYAHEGYRSQQRPPQQDQRQSFTEVFMGLVDSIRNDTKTLGAIVICLACAVVVLGIAGISSCVRGSESNTDANIPVVSVASQQYGSTGSTGSVSSTRLDASVDLDNVPLNSVLSIVVDEDASVAPWIEVRVDDVAKEAYIKEPGSSLQYTVTRNAYVLVSDARVVTITVNGTPVTPTPENDTYVLRLAVAPDQIPAPEEPTTDQTV